MKKKRVILLLVVLAFLLPIHAQNGMIVQHYTLEEGLQHGILLAERQGRLRLDWYLVRSLFV